ncbi:MAG: hypothetical protein AAGA60_09510 [Cyanobacteria bacterium P01_E01_bin.42]
MFFLMGWRRIQSWVGVAIAPETPSQIDLNLDIAENLRKTEQSYFLERRSLL